MPDHGAIPTLPPVRSREETQRVEYIANFMSAAVDPMAWAREREAEGWQVLGCADHFWSSTRPFPHCWVTLGAMAVVTERCQLTTSFANNLFRSPVEFALASMQMQTVSNGRFEAGLGAGWTKDECLGAGVVYPEPRDRAGRLIEAVQIVRQLFDTGKASFRGQYYDIEVPPLTMLPPGMAAPPLVASVGGARTMKGCMPYLDRVEIKLSSNTSRGGALDFPGFRDITSEKLHDMVASVRALDEQIPISVFILCSCGDDPRTTAVHDLLDGSFYGGFFGPAEQVAESMQRLAEAGVDRVQVSPFSDESFPRLAEHLFAG
jgi:alkanesulfonate monooxygenase SsuD/methylene tetrahydromethanopterin reductase-like flavin-dependent oxidoreductase (luciferase family)